MFNLHVTVDPNISRFLYAKPADANQVLAAIKDVQQFYQDSFTNLLWFMGIAFLLMTAVVGVVMPLVLQWLQNRSFDKTEKNLLEKFKNDIESAKADLKSEISIVKKDLQEDAKREFTRVKAESLGSLAASLTLASSRRFEATVIGLRTASAFAELLNKKGLEAAINLAYASKENLTKELIAEPIKRRKDAVSLLIDECTNLLDKLKEKRLDTKYFEQVISIKNTINEVKLD